MYGDQQHNFTLVASGAVTKYHTVQIASTSGLPRMGWLATSGNQILAGVAQDTYSNGDEMSVCPFGFSRVVAGGTITQGARITCNSVGKAIAATSGTVILGYAAEAAVENDTFEAFIAALQNRMAL